MVSVPGQPCYLGLSADELTLSVCLRESSLPCMLYDTRSFCEPVCYMCSVCLYVRVRVYVCTYMYVCVQLCKHACAFSCVFYSKHSQTPRPFAVINLADTAGTITATWQQEEILLPCMSHRRCAGVRIKLEPGPTGMLCCLSLEWLRLNMGESRN